MFVGVQNTCVNVVTLEKGMCIHEQILTTIVQLVAFTMRNH
jgi:hypothetical protein